MSDRLLKTWCCKFEYGDNVVCNGMELDIKEADLQFLSFSLCSFSHKYHFQERHDYNYSPLSQAIFWLSINCKRLITRKEINQQVMDGSQDNYFLRPVFSGPNQPRLATYFFSLLSVYFHDLEGE